LKRITPGGHTRHQRAFYIPQEGKMADGQEPTQPIENDTPPTTPPETPPPKTFDESYVKDLRAEAAKHRKDAKAAQTRLAELEAAQAAAETAELEAQGKWKELAEQNAAKVAEYEARLAEGEAALQAERRNTLAVTIATQLGAIDPTDANFVSAVAGIEITAEDAAAQIQQALTALKEARPYLFSTGKPNLASFNPSGQPQNPPAETDEQRRTRLYSGGSRAFFDTTGAGGGVIWPKGEPDK
jgi:hypothetical protein